MAKHKLLLVIFLLLTLAVPVLLFAALRKQELRQHAQTASTITVDFSSPLMINKLGPGANLIHNNEIAYTANGKQAIKGSMYYLTTHIMGFGTDNPNPSPGQYNWSSIDKNVQLMRDTGAVKMITLCCAPDWMKGGTAGQTNWDNLEKAPLAANYKDFAELSKQVAKRYPDVEYFQVWNELKGFWNNTGNRWDYEGYTTMYNQVYTAIKSVRPDAKVGGPYNILMMEDQSSMDVITYWLKNKKGADFLVTDGGPAPPSAATQEFTGAKAFTEFSTWLRKQSGGESLPFGWAEWYPRTSGQKYDANHFNAIIANDYIETMKAGSTYLLMWGVQGDAQGLTGDPGNPEVILTSSGKTTPVYTTMKAFKDFFPPGTQLYKTTTSSSDISIVASKTKAIVVNKLATSQTVTINGKQVPLSAYQVAVVDLGGGSTTPAPTSSIAPTPTVVSPTLYCLGTPCPTLPVTSSPSPSAAPISSTPTSVIPSSSEETPTPEPTTAPVDTVTPTPDVPENNAGGNRGLLIRFLDLIIEFLNLLLKFFK